MRNLSIIFLLFIFFLINGCSEPTSSNDYNNQLVIYGFLVAGNTIDSIYVQHVLPLEAKYSPEAAAILNAVVIVEGNGFRDTLHHDPTLPGRYYSTKSANVIQPKATYTLRVEAPNFPAATATTTVPDTFHILNKPIFTETLRFGDRNKIISVAWTESKLHVDYIIGSRSLDSNAQTTRENRQNQDRAPNKTNFTFNLLDLTTTQVPWQFFNYYGTNEIFVSAIDKNYFDYVSQSVVGGTDIKNIKFNLNNAIGVFGSVAKDSYRVVIIK